MMKNFLKLFLFLIVFFLYKNVYAYNDFLFTEGSEFDSRGGLYTACDLDGNTAYCLYYPDVGNISGEVSRINIDNNQRTSIKTLSERYFYTSIKVVDNGYLLAGLDLNTYKMVVAYYNSSFTLVRSELFRGSTVATAFIIKKIGNDYYVLNEGASSGSNKAIKVSSDFQTMSFLTSLDFDGSDYIEAYNAMVSYMPSDQTVLLMDRLDGGFLGATTPIGSDVVNYLYYYKNGELIWSKEFHVIIGNVVTKDDRFYVTLEDTDHYSTTFMEYSSSGEELHSSVVDLLNNNRRFFLGNFVIGEYNDSLLLLSYAPGSDPSDYTEWAHYKITSMRLSSEIKINTNTGGNIDVNKEKAFSGEDIYVTASPDKGYSISSIQVIDYDGNQISIDSNHFIMPNSAVTVKAEFRVNSNPKTGRFYLFINLIIGVTCIFALYMFYKKILRKSA